jgi:hypothetical protein
MHIYVQVYEALELLKILYRMNDLHQSGLDVKAIGKYVSFACHLQRIVYNFNQTLTMII